MTIQPARPNRTHPRACAAFLLLETPMRTLLILAAALLAGCVTGAPPEAAAVRDTGDKEVGKLRQLAEINITARFDRAAAATWAEWRAVVDQAKALDPSGKGLVPAEFMERATDLRDDKLVRIATAKARALGQAADLHENYVTSSGAIWDAWAAQGKVTGETVNALREASMQGAQMYSEYRQAKSLAKEAKRAAEAAKSDEGEGQ